MQQKQHNQGFALLFSVVVISVVVITTLAVSSLVRRGLELTTIGERSMEAFYAADAGLECALYWDIRNRDDDIFRRPTDPVRTNGQIRCLDDTIDFTGRNFGSYRTYTFSVRDDTMGRDLCADIEIQITGLNTEVYSRGYNTCNPGDPERIERGLRAEY